jgi:CPA2 family monovalent cation:H+ antiporter-2
MAHDSALIATVAVGIVVAFIFGVLAARIGMPPIVGYLLAGVAVGPFTPGYVADSGLASQLAELGVILLMFGVGLHFSLNDLIAVRRVVVPGALLQTTITTGVGIAIGRIWGWGWGSALLLGLSLGIAGTVVLLKGLERQDQLDSPTGRIAIGWLVVEDVTMVFALVLLPAIAGMIGGSGGAAMSTGSLAMKLGVAILKVLVFVALMVVVGRRFVPWLLEHVARLGSRELFTLAVLTTALGIGTVAAEFFGVSFALGAFFAGAVISESELSHRAAADALPMQDAFAVLFFVSVGMLFDPSILIPEAPRILVLAGVIILWKTFLTFGIVRALGESPATALIMGAGVGQIGEFSFIVAELGVSLKLLPPDARVLIVGAALVAITANGPILAAAARLARRFGEKMESADPRLDKLHGHVILVGYGRIGATVSEALARAGAPHVVIEEQERVVADLRKRGGLAIGGDASRPDVLERARIQAAKLLVVTAPEPVRARRIVEIARAANPRITIAIRTHSANEQAFLDHLLATAIDSTGRAVYTEREAALSLAHYSLVALGRTDDEADLLIDSMRATNYTSTYRPPSV